MKRMLALCVCCLLIKAIAAAAEPWKPAAGPLMTRWAKEVTPENVHPEYPRPQMVRPDWLNLNGLWQLEFGNENDHTPIGKDLSKRILVPFPVESALSDVMQRADRLWYRRMFQVPAVWLGRRVLLHFGAVDWEAEVFVNGKEIGTHRGGYDPFSFDITDALTTAGDQELVVRVFDPSSNGPQPRGKQMLDGGECFYTPSTGIWQSVWLEPVPASRIGRLVMTPNIDHPCLTLNVEGINAENCTVEAIARDGETVVAKVSGKPGTEIKLEIPRDQLELWSPDSPFLYDLTVSLHSDGKAIDTVESYFGMRKIALGKDQDDFVRMQLNGKYIFQLGPLDQGFWPDGLHTAPTDEALRYDIEVTKKLGFNMIRKHIKVEPARWYYWCDKLGMLVWQDMPGGDNDTPKAKQQFELELRRMVEGLRNHPSIIMWVVFNENYGQHDTPRYVEMVRKLDFSRLVNNASGGVDNQVGDLADIHEYQNENVPEPEPNRATVWGEFGGLGMGVKGHTWSQTVWMPYGAIKDGDDLMNRYRKILDYVHEAARMRGLSAAVYTQTADVETECNGLMTYDREIIKFDVPKTAEANRFP
jgi:beta-galactosidase/beta-glucuronidase